MLQCVCRTVPMQVYDGSYSVLWSTSCCQELGWLSLAFEMNEVMNFRLCTAAVSLNLKKLYQWPLQY